MASSRSTRAFARAVAKGFGCGLPSEVFARAGNNWFAWLSSLEVGVLQSAVIISWVGGPLDIVHNGARRLSCAFEEVEIASPAQKMKVEKRKRRRRGEGDCGAKEKALILYSQKLVESQYQLTMIPLTASPCIQEYSRVISEPLIVFLYYLTRHQSGVRIVCEP